MKHKDPELDAITHEYLSGDIRYAEYATAVRRLLDERKRAARDQLDKEEPELTMEDGR